MGTLLLICYHLTPRQSPSISFLSLTVTHTVPHLVSSLFPPIDYKTKGQIFYMVLCVWLGASSYELFKAQWLTIYTTCTNITKRSSIPTQYIYVFYMVLTTNIYIFSVREEVKYFINIEIK